MIKRFLILPLILILILCGCAREDMVQESRLLMNTIVNIKVPSNRGDDITSAIAKSFFRIKEIQGLMNRYDKDSEVSLISKIAPNEKFAISPQMAFVLRKALELYRISDGAFDVTVGPLVDLWGSHSQKNSIPVQKEIEDALSKISSKKILLNADGTISLSQEGIKIDLSAIAKGYAVDEAIRVLKDNGIENALVDAGGDIYCLGDGPNRDGWHIGIKDPRKGGLVGRLTLKDRAVVTSGDYQNFFIVDNKRYSHIIDPKTGYPISDIPMSVTVIAPDCITADGLATAIFVMGPTDGLRLAERLDNVEAIIISKDKDTLKIERTSGIEDIYESL